MIRLRIISGRLISFALAAIVLLFCFFNSFSVLGYAEELSDDQLYGYEEENVLGHEVRRNVTPKTDSKLSVTEANPQTESTTEEKKDLSVSKEASKKADKTESNKEDESGELCIVITGVSENAYYNDNLDINIDISGVADNTNVEAVIKRRSFGGVEEKHDVIMKPDENRLIGKEAIIDEGKYTLDIQVLDGLKVLKHTDASFILDKTSPQIEEALFSELIVDEINPKILVDRMVSDDSPVDTVVKVNGTIVGNNVITDEGEYDVALLCTDKAGNVSSAGYNVSLTNGDSKVDSINQQSTYHQLIGVVMLIGSILFYRERKSKDSKEAIIDEDE